MMLTPFFVAAMQSPARQWSFRLLAVSHALTTAAFAYWITQSRTAVTVTVAAQALLILGLVEGAALVGWRLTQLPKSQALEFLLTSPLQPTRLFLAEASVGLARYCLVWLAGLPPLAALALFGQVRPDQFLVLAGLPLAFGLFAGAALTAWIYEPPIVQRIGQLLSIAGVGLYLVVGVLAAEKLVDWLEGLPEPYGEYTFRVVKFGLDWNPFGVVQYYFDPTRTELVAERRAWITGLGAALLTLLCLWRAATRLVGHYADRHYRPIDSSRATQSIGDEPLSWWAVKRVMEYSGRVNLYLAGGFSLLYAAYLVFQDRWPDWMGQMVFQLMEDWGGPGTIAAGLCVMAAVPAVFQFGLWDATPQARCARLELLLLTDLNGTDYWRASFRASWKRGRGYLFAALVLWAALAVSGRVSPAAAVAAATGGVVYWCLAFAVGFRGFAKGAQTSGLSSLFALGLPLLLMVCVKTGHDSLGALLPIGLGYYPVTTGIDMAWAASMLAWGAVAVGLVRTGLVKCEPGLRAWYDANQGLKAAA